MTLLPPALTPTELDRIAQDVLTARQYEAWKISETMVDRYGRPAGYVRVSLALQCSPANARYLLNRARTKLGNHLTDHYGY